MELLVQFTGVVLIVVIGLMAMAESGLFVGLVVPGETVMLLGGALAWQGRASLLWVIVAACLGGIVGDSVSYEVGRRFGPRLISTRLGRRVGDERWRRARHYVRTRGGRAIFFGRFVGVFRALVPAVAGWARVPYGSFLLFNIAGGLIWGTGIILLGAAAGESWRLVERWVGLGGLILAAALTAVLGLAVLIACRRALSEAGAGKPSRTHANDRRSSDA